MPQAGSFSISNLSWAVVRQSSVSIAAAIPSDRIEDFLEGEGRRGDTRIQYYTHGNRDPKKLVDKKGSCIYCQQKRMVLKERAAAPVAAAFENERRSAVSMGESIKKGCRYCFYAKEFVAKPGWLYITFPAVGNVWSCEHCSEDGINPHAGCKEHVQHTNLVQNRVIEMLKLRAGIAMVKSEIRKLCLQRLGISMDNLSAEEISDRVLGSQHARDFFIADDTIRNWRTKYVDPDYRRHANDRMSVEALFRADQAQAEEKRCWLRCQISHDGEDVRIFLATPGMRQRAVRLGHKRPMFMDATHGMQQYGFKLATLHVQNEHCKGQPVAWAVLRSESAEVYQQFLKDFKDACDKESGGDLQPSCFIVDNSNAEINGIRSVFGGQPILLCLFHVLKAWLLQVRYKLVNKSRFQAAFSMLKSIVYLQAPGSFDERLAAIHEQVDRFKLDFQDEARLVQYFEQHWLPKFEMWAMCLRTHINHGGSNTTALCEGYHNGLKRILRSEGGEAYRLDRLLHHLLHFVSEQQVFKEIQKYAGWGINKKAEQHVMNMLKVAKSFDASRFRFEDPDEALGIVRVMNSDKSAVKCTMVAYYLHVYGDSEKIQRKILYMLGTRLGYHGGCSITGISDLTDALSLLSVQQPDSAPADQPMQHIAANLQVQPEPAVAFSAADPSQSQVVPCKRKPPNEVAHANHTASVFQLVSAAMTALRVVPPEVQFDVMSTQLKMLQVMLHSTEQATSSLLSANFQKAEVSFVRKRNPIERYQANQDRKRACGSCDVQKSNFQRVQKDDLGKVSKALAGGCSFNEAASHVQTCLGMGRVNGEKSGKAYSYSPHAPLPQFQDCALALQATVAAAPSTLFGTQQLEDLLANGLGT